MTDEAGTVQPVPPGLQVVRSGAGTDLDLIEGEGSAVAIVWPGMGARFRTIHRFTLGPLARTVSQQHEGEAVYAVIEGEATIVDFAGGEPSELVTGAMVHLEPHTSYSFVGGTEGAVILGGPCPPDSRLYSA